MWGTCCPGHIMNKRIIKAPCPKKAGIESLKAKRGSPLDTQAWHLLRL